MANILELASYLAYINDSPSEEVFNDLSYNGKDFPETSSTEVQAPDTNSLDTSDSNWKELSSTASSALPQSSAAPQFHHIITSSPNSDIIPTCKPSVNQDDSFDLLINGFANSPLSSPSIESGFINFLDDITQKEISGSTRSVTSNCSSDSGVCLSNDISASFCKQSSVVDNSSSVNDSSDSTPSSTPYHQISESDTSNTDKQSFNSTSIDHKRPDASYVELIAMCILASPNNKVALSEIYDYILKTYPYFETALPAWRISVRHHLSTCESFIKVGRVPLSRGFYWAIHPACKEDFKDGVFDRKLMRKRLGNLKPRKQAKKVSHNKTNSTKVESKEKSTEDRLTTAINNIPMSPTLESPYVPTTGAVNSQLHEMPYHSYYNNNKQFHFDTYNTVYSRLSGLIDQEPKSSTPVRGCPPQQYFQYPSQNSNSVPYNNLTGLQSNYYNYGGDYHKTGIYFRNYSNYSSAGSHFQSGHAPYYPGYSSEQSYKSANYPSISVPYGHQQLSGKISQQSSSRYLPY